MRKDSNQKIKNKFPHLIIVLFCIVVSSCAEQNNTNPSMLIKSNLYSYGIEINKVDIKTIPEASGIVNSINNPNTLWTHNDSGNSPHLYLISKENGSIIHEVELLGLNNNDWEDITIGPCISNYNGNCIYLGDIGDNNQKRNIKQIYVFEEPTFNSKSQYNSTIEDHSLISFYMEDGTFDSEALMFSPQSNDIYVISKKSNKQSIYKLPNILNYNGNVIKAKKIATLDFIDNLITASDISSDGNYCLIKSYSKIYYWIKNSNESWDEIFMKKSPKILNYNPEEQGESICWGNDEKNYYTLSELRNDIEPVLIRYYKN